MKCPSFVRQKKDRSFAPLGVRIKGNKKIDNYLLVFSESLPRQDKSDITDELPVVGGWEGTDGKNCR